jgi:hypothetical protein
MLLYTFEFKNEINIGYKNNTTFNSPSGVGGSKQKQKQNEKTNFISHDGLRNCTIVLRSEN